MVSILPLIFSSSSLFSLCSITFSACWQGSDVYPALRFLFNYHSLRVFLTSMESDRQQASSGLQNFSQYSGRSRQCCNLDGFDFSTDFQLFQSLTQVLRKPFQLHQLQLVFLHPQARSKYWAIFSISFTFILWSSGRQDPSDGKFYLLL